MGVPVIATLNGAATRRAHWYAFDWWFLTYCASPEQRVRGHHGVGSVDHVR
jgi:hypothetical protein